MWIQPELHRPDPRPGQNLLIFAFLATTVLPPLASSKLIKVHALLTSFTVLTCVVS
jgi:hypothetical protein